MDIGFIKLHRSLLNWEWYSDINTTRLFLHLLLTVNWQDKEWHGAVIKRGQIVTSLAKLSEETGLSRQQTRRAIFNMQTTHEITRNSTNKYTLITVEKYEDYQGQDSDSNTQLNKQTTRNSTPTKE